MCELNSSVIGYYAATWPVTRCECGFFHSSSTIKTMYKTHSCSFYLGSYVSWLPGESRRSSESLSWGKKQL